jgi:tetraacyldisaccharide 4'-kinase
MRPPDFWGHTTLGARIAAAALAPLGALYGASVAWKRRRSVPYRARVPVICVGNLTVGGSGKTPVAIAIAGLLQQQGASATFLSRGYGRKTAGVFIVDAESHDEATVGDEALLLARVAPTIASIDRAASARLAENRGAQVVIMDDGYQNFSLHKDFSIVVVDGETGFGNGRIIPAGPLREPLQEGLERANAVVVVGEGDPPLPGFAGPVLRARLCTTSRMDQKRVVAFAGIGRPEKFFATLREAGATLVETHAFADHHVYSHTQIARLRKRAGRANAALVTTEKDFVRLAPKERAGTDVLPVRAVFDDEPALRRLIDRLVSRESAAK